MTHLLTLAAGAALLYLLERAELWWLNRGRSSTDRALLRAQYVWIWSRRRPDPVVVDVTVPMVVKPVPLAPADPDTTPGLDRGRLPTVTERYARLRELPPGRHRLDSTVGPRPYAPGGAA